MNNHGTISMVVTVKVILISTDSVHLLEEKLNDLIPAYSVVVRYNMKETSLNDVLEEASYVSLFDDMKYLVVKNSDFFGKSKLTEKEEQSFLSYLDNPYPCTTIIFTTYDTIDKRKSITKKIIDNYKLIELKSPKNYLLRFDFYLPYYDIFIEFQGKQHFEQVDCWGGKQGFLQRQKYDNLKREFCGNKLYEISYKDINNIPIILKSIVQRLD